jgi:hypothetical protein
MFSPYYIIHMLVALTLHFFESLCNCEQNLYPLSFNFQSWPVMRSGWVNLAYSLH